ncbi:hypothetical protein [Mycolicibacterium sphagni]|uniref:hypothetical protein n=1 Tax=Mycolicibacterium sphagni TaxID=1786 RepID=UPI0021F3B830|nr:hypothetical protein [Mycolicibacterium sphagni]MCV7174911.1 hypothetical protein [Mycolicibacterium sphagni]
MPGWDDENDRVPAIQAWRWMPGATHVQQSFIVRVPPEEIDNELHRRRLATLPGLPPPNIVQVPAEPYEPQPERRLEGRAVACFLPDGRIMSATVKSARVNDFTGEITLTCTPFDDLPFRSPFVDNSDWIPGDPIP